jgi:hypothetical protein
MSKGAGQGSSPSGATSAEDEIARLSGVLGITVSADEQLSGLTVGDVKELRSALGPFAEIARRMGWDRYDRDSTELGRHIIEAPAPDVDPTAAYCLTVGAFWRAAHLLDGDVDFDHPAGSRFDLRKPKRWWRRRRRSAD